MSNDSGKSQSELRSERDALKSLLISAINENQDMIRWEAIVDSKASEKWFTDRFGVRYRPVLPTREIIIYDVSEQSVRDRLSGLDLKSLRESPEDPQMEITDNRKAPGT
jgi:hypothetical protein